MKFIPVGKTLCLSWKQHKLEAVNTDDMKAACHLKTFTNNRPISCVFVVGLQQIYFPFYFKMEVHWCKIMCCFLFKTILNIILLLLLCL